jgi:hypothetical protein
MNGNLFKIVLISVVAILLAIIGGVMSADGDPFSIALAVSPFVLAALFLMKEKVWYLWIWLPLLFLPISELTDYAPLFAYVITIPFYLWNAMLKRSTLTWNSAPLLDIVVLVLFIHVGYVFLIHPFGLGLNVLEDYYGGKGYVLFLQALLAYLCLSSLKTTSNELGKVLQWAVFLAIIFTLISTAKGILSPNSAGANPAAASLGKRRLRRHAAINLSPNFPIGGSTTHHQLLRVADDQTSLVGRPSSPWNHRGPV